MPKTYTVKIEGDEFDLPVTLGVSREIAERVFDPLQISIETQRTGLFPATFEQIVDILHIGLKHGRYQKSREWVSERLFDAGITRYLEPAATYISLMIAGAGASTAAKPPAKSKKKSRSG